MRAAKLETILAVAVTVNHEVNNPLTTILTGPQFLLRRLPDADDMTRLYRGRIVENTERIAQVAQRLQEVREPLQTQYIECLGKRCVPKHCKFVKAYGIY